MEPYQISIIVAVVFAIAELITATFVFLSFSIAALVVAALQYFEGGFLLNRDLLFFIAGSVFFTVLFRALFRSKKDVETLNVNKDVNRY